MRKKIYLSIIFLFLAIFAVNLQIFDSQSNLTCVNACSIIEITDIKDLSQNDNYNIIKIDKNISTDSLINELSNVYDSDDNIEATISKYLKQSRPSFAVSNSVSYEDLQSICDELDYNLIPTADGYKIYGKYQLKRLIVMGKLSEYYGATSFYAIDDELTCLCFDSEEETKLAYEQLQLNKDVIVCIDAITTIADSDATCNTNYNTWGAEAIDLKIYNDYILSNGSKNEIVVAVLDTGINTSHELFQGRILTDSNDDLVGYSAYDSTYTYSGYDFEDDNWGTDAYGKKTPIGHGSHVSGTIAELTPSNVKILPMKVLDDEGSGSLLYIYAALAELIDTFSNTYNIACVNMSLGVTSTDEADAKEYNEYFSEYFDILRDKNILPVVAAGNDYETDTSLTAPAGCDNAIVVSALSQVEVDGNTSYVFANFSNCGATIDISAPGTNIYSACIGKSNTAAASQSAYTTLSGTSQATPHVSATVALLALDETYYNVSGKHDALSIETQLLENMTTTNNLLTTNMITYGLKNNSITFETYYGNGMLTFKSFKGSIPYTVSDTVVSYDGKYHNIDLKVDASITNVSIMYGITPGNLNISPEAAKTHQRFTECNGTCSIYFSITADNYSITKGSADLTINPVDLTITLGKQTFIYGNEISLDPSNYSVTSGTYITGTNLNLKLSTNATSSSPVNTYTITATSDNRNYNLTIMNGILAIEPRKIKIALENQGGTYGDVPYLNNSLFSIDESTPLASFDSKSSLGITLATTASKSSNVGYYPITATISNTNYSLMENTAGKLLIKARNISLNMNNQSGIYGDNHQQNLNKSAYTISNCVDLNDISITLSTTASSSSPIGDYPISATFSSSSGNHSLTVENTSNGIFTIKQKEIKITTSLNGTYGDNHNLLTLNNYNFVGDGFVNGDTPTLTVSTTAKQLSPIGNYDLTISCSNLNYTISTESKFTIIPRPIKITVSYIATYGDTINLDNATITLNEGSSLAQESDDLGLTLTHNAGKTPSVNSYSIILTENTNKNYSVSLTSGILTIQQKEIILKISNLTKTYGDELSQSSFTISTNNLVYSDSISDLYAIIKLIDSHNNQINISNSISVGSYKITIESIKNSNYSIKTCTDGTLTIKQKEVEITIGNKEISYGESVDLSSFEIDLKAGYSLVEDDDLGVCLTVVNPSTNVGTYSIKYSYHSNSNYSIKNSASAFGNLTITAKEIKITISNATYTYGDEIADFEFSVVESNLEYSDSKEVLGIQIVALDSSGNETTLSPSSNVGNYTLTLKNYTTKNYSITAEDGIITINPKMLTLTINDINLQYGEQISSNKFTFSVFGLKNEDTQDILNLQLTSTAINQTPNAGSTFNIVYSSHNNSNYEISNTSAQANLKITRRQISVEILVTSTYGNDISLSSPTVKLTKGSIIKNDKLDLRLAITDTEKYNSSTDNGEYDDALTIVSYNENYDIITYTTMLKIGDRIVTITISNQECEYGEKIEIDNSKYEISNLPSGVIATIDLYIEENPQQGSDAGNYSINASHSGIPESCIVEIVKGTFTITKRNISINVPSISIQYGDEISNSILIYSITSGTIYNSDLSISLSTLAQTGNSVNNYEINATYTEANGKNNYNVSFNIGKLIITEREIELTIQDQNSTYGNEHNLYLDNSKYIASNVVAGDNLNIVLTSSANHLSFVGSEQEISVKSLNPNYKISKLSTGKLNITKRPIEIKLNISPNGVYGDNHTLKNILDSANYSVIGTNNILNEDVSTISLTYHSDIPNTANVGSYSLVIESSNSNYSFSTSSLYSVKPKGITITIQNKTLTYGEIPNVNNFEFTINSDLVGTDTKQNLNIQLKLDCNEVIYHVGTYPIILDSFNNQNYTISANTDALLTISPKPITITIQEQSGIYGEDHQTNLAQTKWSTETNAIINGDNLNIELSTDATALSDINGNHHITLTYNNNDYQATLNTAKFTVLPRPVEIKIYQTVVYGEDIILNNNQFEIINGNLVNDTNLGLSLTTTAQKYSPVNTYTISHSYTNLNYNLTISSATLEITPRPITITIGNSESIYGNLINLDNLNYTISSGSVVNNDNLQISLYSTADHLSNVGKYKVLGTCSNENYNTTFINGEHTINKRHVTIQLLNQSTKRWLTFSISNNAYQVIEGSIVAPEDFEIEIYSDAGMLSLVGTYDLKAKCKNNNYDITFIDAKIKVNFSIFDFAVPIAFVVAVILVIISVIHKQQKKNKNKELFDKWIKW